MAKTGCRCGVGLWNGYCPGGVNWDVFPKWQVEEVIKEHPGCGPIDVTDYISEKYDNGDFRDLWLCRRCRRIQIWDFDHKYESYKKILFDNSITIEEIFAMEEWIAYSDWDFEEEITAAQMLKNPLRPHRYFLSNDQRRIYVYNTDTESIEFIYLEETVNFEKNLWRDEHGRVYENKYTKHGTYLGDFYLDDGTEVQYTWGNERLSSAVYGAIIGDALGVPYEFKERGSFNCSGMIGYGTHNQPAGTWSDDSSMILATCKSIKENGGKIVIEDLKVKFREWLIEGKYTPFGEVFDCGNTTRDAILTGVARGDECSNGNGSLMRILPLAFIDSTDEEIRAVSAITHSHWISQEACVIYVNIIRESLKPFYREKTDPYAIPYEIKKERVYPWDHVFDVVHSMNLPKPFDRLHYIDSLPEEEIQSSGYVVDTLEAALWCVLTSKDYDECVLKAVNLGGDTDTIACLAGGMKCVLNNAFDSIIDPWFNEIKNNDLIQECLF